MTITVRMASLVCAGALAFGSAVEQRASAEVDQVQIALGYGIGYLPLAIMQDGKLIEKHLKEAGLANASVVWAQIGAGSAMNDALLSGTLHFASGGVTPFLLLWDKTRGSYDVKGVGTLCSMPSFLNTRNPNIKSVKDFTDKDRIALAGAGSGVQTIYLQMAVAKAFGIKNYGKLNPIMVNLSHPEGMAAFLSGTEVNSHFTAPPFQYQELARPGVHKVLSSYDIMGGSSSFLMVWATSKFRNENPKTYAAVFGAFREATDILNRDKKRAAEIYVKSSKGKDSADEILKMLDDPDTKFTLTPERVMKFVEFMNEVGTLKNKPSSWKDLFMPEVHDLPGS